MMGHRQDSKLSEAVFEPASEKSKIQHLEVVNTGNSQLYCIAKYLVLLLQLLPELRISLDQEEALMSKASVDLPDTFL